MTQRRTTNPLVVALGLFTTIPMPAVSDINARTARRAMAAFPVVGIILGLIAGGVTWLTGWLGGPLLGGVLGVATIAWLTGGLHLDGVADTADGLGSRKPAAQALEIMRRSDIGPMGVIVLLLVLLLDVASLVGIAEAGSATAALALLAAVMLGRVSVVWATTSAQHGARPQGFGALFHGVTIRFTAAVWGIASLVVTCLLGWLALGIDGTLTFGVATAVALGMGWWWRGHLARRLGGLTGDTFGSIIEVTQTGFLAAAALVLGVLHHA